MTQEELDECIYQAAVKGQTDKIRELAAAGADINAQDEHGRTALRKVSQMGLHNIMKLLLELGADPNICDKFNGSALMDIACSGNAETARLLIEAGANVNNREWFGRTSLMWAAERHSDIVRILLDAGADVSLNSLKSACGLTALHYAVMNGNEDSAIMLLDAGADPNAADSDGLTPLHYASDFGHTQILRRLVGAGGDIYKPDGSGRTVLDALQSNCPKFYGMYLDKLVALAEKTARKRIKKEDASRKTNTGYEFDI